MALYDKISNDYDATRKADPFIVGRLFSFIQAGPAKRYLDLACGSGNYALALGELGLDITGIDISRGMLNRGRSKSPSINWVMGDVEVLPFRDASFNGAFSVLAIHHIRSLSKMFAESFRVLTERLVIFTATREQMEYYWLNDYFPEAMRKSIAEMPSQMEIEETLLESGFRQIVWQPYDIRDDLQDYFLYVGKNRPELYLDPRIRAGSSTFTSLADQAEVEKGCRSLEVDIESGRIREVLQIYHGQGGDYMFVVASKFPPTKS